MADKNWTGNANSFFEKYTLLIGGTWLAAETISLTISNKTITLTLGTTVTTSQVATDLAAMWNGNPALSAGYTSTSTGNLVPEMNEVTASVSSSTITFVGDTSGLPFVMSKAQSTASGTTTLTNTVDATGVNDLANTGNFVEAAALASTNTFNLDRPVSIQHGLDQSAVTLTAWNVSERFTAASYAGLPARRSTGYEEYRETFLKIGCTTFSYYGSSGLFKWNAGSVQTAATMYTGGSSVDVGRSAFQFIGTHASNTVTVLGGDVGIAGNTGEVSTVLTLKQTGGNVFCGSGATLTTVTKDAGSLTLNSSVTTLVTNDGETRIRGGTHTNVTMGGGTLTATGGTITNLLMLRGSATLGLGVGPGNSIVKNGGMLDIYTAPTALTSNAGDTYVQNGGMTTCTINSGTFYYGAAAATIVTLNLQNCTFDLDQGSTAAVTVTTLNVTGNVTIRDSAKRLTVTNKYPFANGRITYTALS
jgi:hypothetical protein